VVEVVRVAHGDWMFPSQWDHTMGDVVERVDWRPGDGKPAHGGSSMPTGEDSYYMETPEDEIYLEAMSAGWPGGEDSNGVGNYGLRNPVAINDEIRDYYGDGFGNGDGKVPDVELAGLPVAAGITVGLGWLARVGFPKAAQAVRQGTGGVSSGLRHRWEDLPGWLRAVLVAVGVTEGVPVLFDTGEGDFGLVPLPFSGGQDGPEGASDLTEYVARRQVSSWNANGVKFWRLDDGRLAVRNKHGVWKIWRPKKPVMLYSTGAGARDLETLIRADNIINKTGKKMAKMLRRRGFRVARTSKSD